MTGPHMLAKVAYDEYYNDMPKMMADLGKLLRHNFKMLVDGRLQAHPDRRAAVHDVGRGGGAKRRSMPSISRSKGLPDDVHVSIHICQGNYAVGKEYDAQIGHRYFDTGRYKADLVCKIDCSSYLVEHDMTHHYQGPPRQPAARRRRGRRAGSEGRERRDRCRAHPQAQSWLAPEQTIVTSSCGFNHLPRHVAFGKLKAMTEAKRVLGG